MRRGLSKIGLFLLVLAVLLSALAGCSRPAEERESDTAEATATVTDVPSRELASPSPGQTVVSAVTRSPGAGTVAATETPATGLAATPTLSAPAAVEPTATTAISAAAATATLPPPATKAPTPSSEGGTVWHTVQRGESLAAIAQRYDTTAAEITKANNLSNPNKIYAGQKLKIPTSGQSADKDSGDSKSGCRHQHRVKRGDWVWQIARDYGVSPYDILKANNLTVKQANTIHPGRVLCIP